MAEKKEIKMKENWKEFCRNYVANGYNATLAYGKAYPNAKYETCSQNGCKLLKEDRVKQYIQELQHDRFESLFINADRIAEEVSKMAFANFDENNSATTKLKALELLGKQLGLYVSKVDANVNGEQSITIKITDDEEQENANERETSQTN